MSAYQTQLDEKYRRLHTLFDGIDMPEWTVYPSPPQHYRMRAEFRIWHEGGNIRYAMFAPGQKASRASLTVVDGLPAASAAINDLMPKLLAAAAGVPVLRERWYQCEFLSTLSGEMLVSMIYHKQLDDEWEAAARVLQDGLGIMLIGRSRGQKKVLSRDYVCEEIEAAGRRWCYRQPEGGFTQPNAAVCADMLDWAVAAADGAGGDLLELYCGNGNFTVPLSFCFDKVLATEVSKTSVAAARWNLAANGVDNVALVRLSAEELTEALSGGRSFRRLQEAEVCLDDYRFSTVFVDPPRAGIDADTLRLLARFERIIYVSCNPETLRANVGELLPHYRICRAALFDQFPFTPHIESGLVLSRR